MRIATGACLLVLLVVGAVRAEEATVYGPVPASLAAVRGSTPDEALAGAALRTLEEEAVAGRIGDALFDARALLVMLEDVGLRRVGERLAAGDVDDALLPHLLHVLASAAHPAADTFLAQAATSGRSVTRTVAADGLGAGRTPAAVETLAALCGDPVPGVRAAALRALFAIDTPEAAQARQALPVDVRDDLHARRLRWHRLRGRASPALLPLARAAWAHGRSPEERLTAARLLALPSVEAPLDDLEDVVAELGTDALGAALRRLARDVPRRGYDRGAARLAAITAAFACAVRGDEALRTRTVDRMVGWLARPVRLGPYERLVPEDVLRMVLPDWGAAVREPALRRLRVNAFQKASDGIDLLLEALDREDAAAALRALVTPGLEPPVDTWVRVAAAGGLRELGLVGDEALARTLVSVGEEPMIRRHAVRALVRDEANWAVPLLAGFVTSEDELLASDALATLELRDDEASRSFLVEHLFTRAVLPEVRMEYLVAPLDEVAFAVLERALSDERETLRRAALRQLHQIPALRADPRTLPLLHAYEARAEPGMRRSNELQQVSSAFFALAPEEGVRWMRDHWEEFVALGWEHVAMRTLQNVPSGPASEAMVDLVLEKMASTDRPVLLQEATTALQARRGHREDEVDAFWRRALTQPDEEVVVGAVRSLDHPGHADLTDLLVPRLERLDLSDAGVLPEAADLLDVLRHQPAARVEPVLLGVIRDVNADHTLRQKAAVGLLGRVSPEGRAALLAWLTSDVALMVKDDDAVARLVARVVGTGGGEVVARRAFEVLRPLLLDTYATERALDPEVPPEGKYGWHIGALARAIAFTGHEPTVGALLDLVFEDRFARYARRAVALQARRLSPVDATSSARAGPSVDAVWHRQDALYAPLVWEVGQVLENVKPAGDALLARQLERILGEARSTGRLAIFPDLYLDRVIAHLIERSTGERHRAAETVERWVGITEPAGGATEFGIARQQVDRFARARRFADAVDAQTRQLGILARRAYDDEVGYSWRRGRAVLDAWRGAAAAADGAEGAEALLARAVARQPYGPRVLSTVAHARALTQLDLEQALQLARRAVQLERRLGNRITYENADVLALVLLELGRFDEAVAAIEPVLQRVKRQRDPGGRYHLRAGEAYLGAERPVAARRALLEALRLEPSLDATMREDPWLEAVRADGTLEALIRHAEEEALAPTIE